MKREVEVEIGSKVQIILRGNKKRRIQTETDIPKGILKNIGCMNGKNTYPNVMLPKSRREIRKEIKIIQFY
jgi:hypothetical protein